MNSKLDYTTSVPEQYEIVIIGGGPAGLAAALYASRARRKTIVLERDTPGGKLHELDRVEDYPGMSEGIDGPELGTAMADQAMRFGAEIRTEEVREIDLSARVKKVRTQRTEYEAPAVILATGAASDGAPWGFPYPPFAPNAGLAEGQLPVDGTRHVVVNEWMETEVHGVFAAGDVRQYTGQQIICAAGDGATAAIAADRYLSEEH